MGDTATGPLYINLISPPQMARADPVNKVNTSVKQLFPFYRGILHYIKIHKVSHCLRNLYSNANFILVSYRQHLFDNLHQMTGYFVPNHI